jgi:hypothetical protein
MLHHKVWHRIVPGIAGNLCLACATRRLGRPLRDAGAERYQTTMMTMTMMTMTMMTEPAAP